VCVDPFATSLTVKKKSGPTENRTQAARFKVLCANQLHYRTGSLVRLPLSRSAYLMLLSAYCFGFYPHTSEMPPPAHTHT
jgi:hypothetical protein